MLTRLLIDPDSVNKFVQDVRMIGLHRPKDLENSNNI